MNITPHLPLLIAEVEDNQSRLAEAIACFTPERIAAEPNEYIRADMEQHARERAESWAARSELLDLLKALQAAA